MFATFIYNPLYNALIFLIDILPGASVGLAVIALTVLVKVVLFPVAHKVARTQVVMRKLQPELEKLKKDYKEDKQAQTLKTLELYKEHNINPFFGILVLIIQLPIILGLYWVFYKGGLPTVDTEILYSFVRGDIPPNMLFLGLVDMGGRSVVLALLAGITQYINMHILMPEAPKPSGDTPTLKDDFARTMHMQMKYVMPLIVMATAYFISAAVALYWLTSNVFTIGQELLVRKQMKNHEG